MPADGLPRLEARAVAAAPVVLCRDLVVRYGPRVAVDHVSFSAGPGEVLCILGPNGAGKTSTVECLEGYRRPASGVVQVLGLDPQAQHRALVARIGVMLQRGGVYPMLGPRRALRLFASYYEDPVDPDELLELVRLRPVAHTPWRHLSGGEQARLSLALALVGRPEVLFLDEPTAGVDPEGRLAVREVIRAARDRAACVLVTTHELNEAERLADRVLVLAKGSVVAEGSPASLTDRPGRTREVAFGAPAGLDLEELQVEIGVDATVIEEEPGRYRVKVAEHAAAPGGSSSPAVADIAPGALRDAPGALRPAPGTQPPAPVPQPPAPGALAAAVATWLARRGVDFSDLRVGQSLEEAYLEVLRASGQPPDPDGNPR